MVVILRNLPLADDEINYELYDINNLNGNAYYDLQILQTPVLEGIYQYCFYDEI